MNSTELKQGSSPRWGSAMKMVVALTVAAILIALVIRFRGIIGPLLLAFILSYLIYPLATFLVRKTKIKWSIIISLLYVLIILGFIGLITWGGLALFGQIQSLIIFLQGYIDDLPARLQELSTQVITLGTISIDLSQYELTQLINPVLGSVEPILTRLGSFITIFASGAAEVIGWAGFVMLVSYFILFESRGLPDRIMSIDIPDYAADFRKLSEELGRIWNAFLRGQLLVILITIVVYTVVLSILGVRFAFGLAVLAGLARFVPYAGPAIAWIVYGLVCYLQPSNYFHLPPFGYAILVIGISWLADLILDSLVATRILSTALRIHPAAVLVMALIGANLIGIVGIVLASPVMASISLFWRYITRKLVDMDPWLGMEQNGNTPPTPPILDILKRIWLKFKGILKTKSTK